MDPNFVQSLYSLTISDTPSGTRPMDRKIIIKIKSQVVFIPPRAKIAIIAKKDGPSSGTRPL
jgi:hypothetical protein